MTFELPRAIYQALSCYTFEGKPIWKISEQLSIVKLEVTLKLKDAPPTDRPARAVQQRSAKPVKPTQRRIRPQRPPRLQETQPPADTTLEMTKATIQLSPPTPTSRTITPKPASTPKKRAPPPPTPSPKQQTSRKQITASTPVAEPMDVTPSVQPTDDLNRAFTQPTFVPSSDERRRTILAGQYSFDQPKKFVFRRVFRHRIDNGDILTIVEATHRAKDKTCFYVNWDSSKEMIYYHFKPPRSKLHLPAWWDYIVGVTQSSEPLRYNDASKIRSGMKDLIKRRDKTLGYFARTGGRRA